MYVENVGDGLNYIVYVMLFMSEILKIYKHVFAHSFLNIQWIFNQIQIHQIHQILCIVKIIMISDVSDISLTCLNIKSIWWYGWKALQKLYKTFFGLKICWILRKLWAKMYLIQWHNAAMLLMADVGDVGDVKYFNKRSKATLHRAMLLMSETLEISQCYVITILRYFTSSNYIVYHNSNYSN